MGPRWDHPDADPLGDMRAAVVRARREYLEGLSVSDADRRAQFREFVAEWYPNLHAAVWGDEE